MSWGLALTELGFLNGNHVEHRQNIFPWDTGDTCKLDRVKRAVCKQPRIHLPKVGGLRSTCPKCLVHRVFCASKKKETVCWHNAHFARTKWYEWSAHSTHPKLTLSNRRHHDLFNSLILSVPSKSSLSTIVGTGIHPRHHQRIGGARLLLQQPRAGDYPWQDPGHATNSEAAQSEDSWTGGHYQGRRNCMKVTKIIGFCRGRVSKENR